VGSRGNWGGIASVNTLPLLSSPVQINESIMLKEQNAKALASGFRAIQRRRNDDKGMNTEHKLE
jgi:hypothetical protein